MQVQIPMCMWEELGDKRFPKWTIFAIIILFWKIKVLIKVSTIELKQYMMWRCLFHVVLYKYHGDIEEKIMGEMQGQFSLADFLVVVWLESVNNG